MVSGAAPRPGDKLFRTVVTRLISAARWMVRPGDVHREITYSFSWLCSYEMTKAGANEASE